MHSGQASAAALARAICLPVLTNGHDEKIAKLDGEFVKALAELAKKYDKEENPEVPVAHFRAGG